MATEEPALSVTKEESKGSTGMATAASCWPGNVAGGMVFKIEVGRPSLSITTSRRAQASAQNTDAENDRI